jgi:hypothetical protein
MSREDAEHSYIVLIKQFANVLMNERSLLLAGASQTCTYAHLPTCTRTRTRTHSTTCLICTS